jgi:hypothetical protein
VPALPSLRWSSFIRPDVTESARSASRQLVYTPYVVCGETIAMVPTRSLPRSPCGTGLCQWEAARIGAWNVFSRALSPGCQELGLNPGLGSRSTSARSRAGPLRHQPGQQPRPTGSGVRKPCRHRSAPARCVESLRFQEACDRLLSIIMLLCLNRQ